MHEPLRRHKTKLLGPASVALVSGVELSGERPYMHNCNSYQLKAVLGSHRSSHQMLGLALESWLPRQRHAATFGMSLGRLDGNK